jgi:spore maturation protein CgeB
MRIGYYMMWPKGSLHSGGNVIGDELHGEAMCRALRKLEGVESADLYAPNVPPPPGLDVMVYLNESPIERSWARRHVAYMQNAYPDGSEAALRRMQAARPDGFAFISRRLLEMHLADGGHGIFLPFGVDTSVFYPREPSAELAHEVAYVGSDIKGEERTTRYLLPALRHGLGLYGNWKLPRFKLRFWRRWTRTRSYQRRLAAVERGKIPQEDVPVLYSSAKVNLNFTAQDCVDWDVITLRTFEVLACKGFLISDRVEAAVHELPGCLVLTEGGDALSEQIAYYLARPEERRAIAEKGYRWATANATIESRMKTLLGYLRSLA